MIFTALRRMSWWGILGEGFFGAVLVSVFFIPWYMTAFACLVIGFMIMIRFIDRKDPQ